MPDREKVISGLETIRHNLRQMNHGLLADFCDDALALLKQQEAEKEALASLASLADRRRERVGKVLYDLCELGYPHNFQHEAPWVVGYLYKLTAIIKRAYEVKNNDNT